MASRGSTNGAASNSETTSPEDVTLITLVVVHHHRCETKCRTLGGVLWGGPGFNGAVGLIAATLTRPLSKNEIPNWQEWIKSIVSAEGKPPKDN
jgi:hypothetical protein